MKGRAMPDNAPERVSRFGSPPELLDLANQGQVTHLRSPGMTWDLSARSTELRGPSTARR